MIREATRRDLMLLNPKEIYFAEGVLDYAGMLIDSKKALTLESESGTLLAIFGYTEIWKGVADVWAIVSKNIYGDFYSIRELKRFVHTEMVLKNLHRANLYANLKDSSSVRFAEFLGFIREGLLKKYGPDKADYAVCGKVI